MGADQLGWYLAAGDPWDTARALRAEIKRLEDLILHYLDEPLPDCEEYPGLVCVGGDHAACYERPRDVLLEEALAIRERRKNG